MSPKKGPFLEGKAIVFQASILWGYSLVFSGEDLGQLNLRLFVANVLGACNVPAFSAFGSRLRCRFIKLQSKNFSVTPPR